MTCGSFDAEAVLIVANGEERAFLRIRAVLQFFGLN
jgi:hypothetical protein